MHARASVHERPTRPAPRPGARVEPTRVEAAHDTAREIARSTGDLQGSLAVLRRALASDEPQLPVTRLRAHVEAALATCTHSVHLARELGLYVAPPDRAPPASPAPIAEAVVSAITLAGSRLERRAHVELVSDEDVEVDIELATLVRIFVGIFLDLAECAPDTGRMRTIDVELDPRGDAVEIVVAAPGTTPSAEVMARTLASRDHGTGPLLHGLAAARRLVGAAGGHFDAETDERGTRVLVLLKRHVEDPEDAL